MSYIVDAGVAARWFVREELHDEALALLDLGEPLEAPDLIVAEVANAAWRKCSAGEIGAAQAGEIAGAIVGGVPRLLPSAGLIGRAMGIALRLDRPVYDCIYVACAEIAKGLLITADKRLRRVTRGTDLGFSVRRLDEEIVLPLRIPVSRIERVVRVADALPERHESPREAIGKEDATSPAEERPWERLGLERDASAHRRLRACIDSLSENERADLLALIWLGREGSDAERSDWPRIRGDAERELDGDTTRYMIEKASLADDLRKGLERLGTRDPSVSTDRTNP